MRVSDIAFRPADAGRGDGAALIEAMVAELEVWYGRIDASGLPSATPQDFSAPGGVYLVGYRDAEAVAGGGVKRLDAETGEIKRMYVVPAWRGRGIARLLLGALEDHAARLGYRRVRLDTGPRQAVAQSLYERSGYVAIPDYNANAKASYWGEKAL
jgi:GNAT superfamily N-acetyltransferase